MVFFWKTDGVGGGGGGGGGDRDGRNQSTTIHFSIPP